MEFNSFIIFDVIIYLTKEIFHQTQRFNNTTFTTIIAACEYCYRLQMNMGSVIVNSPKIANFIIEIHF